MQTTSKGDSLHEMPILFSGKNKKKIIILRSAELAERVVIVNSMPVYDLQFYAW